MCIVVTHLILIAIYCIIVSIALKITIANKHLKEKIETLAGNFLKHYKLFPTTL